MSLERLIKKEAYLLSDYQIQIRHVNEPALFGKILQASLQTIETLKDLENMKNEKLDKDFLKYIQSKKYRFITLKELMLICDCSRYTALKIRSDISQEYGVDKNRITEEHLRHYLKLDFLV